MSAEDFPMIVLISGNGSNLQAIIDYIAAHKLPICIRAVISNQEKAYGLERAEQAGIPTEIITETDYPYPRDYDDAIQATFAKYQPKLIVLAGFMRILGKNLVKRYAGQMINIHPSLLPKYPGLNTHERVLEAGDKEHGTTVHFVTSNLDQGPIIAQAKLAILESDTGTSLKASVQQLEYQLYPKVIQAIAENRIKMVGDEVEFSELTPEALI